MPKGYQKVSQENGEDVTSLGPRDTATTEYYTIGQRIVLFFLALTIFNMLLAAANIYYSFQLTGALQKFEDKDLLSLPRIDPFSGEYISSSMKKSFASAAANHLKIMIPSLSIPSTKKECITTTSRSNNRLRIMLEQSTLVEWTHMDPGQNISSQ
ncbi:hypothetical protein GALMADRAFT_209838 [Galerina marginata CBS 339.88]|uniref:Uncharacterized protein n=1 Tax=Galerina marginata (strain CBS 339.88) TaxID=685588 RepID=A0A067TC91_GALM3|nr:hypothetical protein GALMADRAFT_209838 [Galerina marginata CBS 339.88]